MQLGDLLLATVTEVQPYGLFVEAGGVPGLILLPHLSWDRISHPSEIADCNDIVRCKVIGFNGPQFLGSIRETQPELNPWQDPSIFQIGATFHGIVIVQLSYGVFVEHPCKAWALLHAHDIPPHLKIAIGDPLEVEITAVDGDQEKITVRLAEAV